MTDPSTPTIEEILHTLKTSLIDNNKRLSKLSLEILSIFNDNRDKLEQLEKVIELSNINLDMYVDEVSRLKAEVVSLSRENTDLVDKVLQYENQDTKEEKSVMENTKEEKPVMSSKLSMTEHTKEEKPSMDSKVSMAEYLIEMAYMNDVVSVTEYNQYMSDLRYEEKASEIADFIIDKYGSFEPDTQVEDQAIIHQAVSEGYSSTIPDEIEVKRAE